MTAEAAGVVEGIAVVVAVVVNEGLPVLLAAFLPGFAIPTRGERAGVSLQLVRTRINLENSNFDII